MADYYTRSSRTSAPRSEVTLELPTAYTVKVFGNEEVVANYAALPVELLETLLVEGTLRMLNDGAGGKDKTNAERAAGMRKRLDAWAAGNFRIVERGDAQVTLMREVLKSLLEGEIGNSMTDAAFWAAQADIVEAATKTRPEKGKAIKLDLVVESMVNAGMAESIEDLTAMLEEGAAELAKERAAASAKINVTGIKLVRKA